MSDPAYTEVDAEAILEFGAGLLIAAGASEDDARRSAEILLAADLRGVESHGISNIGNIYARRMAKRMINPQPSVSVVSETPAAAVMDGDHGIGFLVADAATEMAIEKAGSAGVGLVSVRNSTHYGAGFYYALKAARQGMIGISVTTGGNIVAPPGGRKRTYGANVISVSAPTGRGFEFVLDGSTSVVAAGKVHIYARRGDPIPQGWIIDEHGQATTDAGAFARGGALLPLGSSPELGAFKGFGLGIFADVLSGVLSGAGASLTITEPGTAAHFLGAIRIDAFIPQTEYIARMDELIDGIKSAERQAGVDEIMIPGEPEARIEKQRRESGTIPLHRDTVRDFATVAAELGAKGPAW